MKKTLFLALATLLVLAGCNSEAPVTDPILPEPAETPTPEETSQTFTSEELGFELTLPETWEVTSTVQETTWAFGATQTVYVKSEAGIDIFAITRFTKAEWAEVQAADGPKPTVLEEEGDYVWAYDSTQDPSGVESYVAELADVLKTFKVL
ncbi:hypothetical protein IPG41_06295 [Candidatus Peregrinibacteria bacterium]|nr:MAG: hypothetical protein IPG41_06295 [Candidatus Peregrinibacteria bacterium]